MLVSAFLTLSCVLFSTREVVAQHEIPIKKAQFPYLAFIYYSDESLVDASGSRFLHGAVLMKPDWLVSAAVDPLGPDASGFPQKTLLARMGATSIDPNFTLNEDEDEQEREVVKVVQPFNHEASKSWRTDVTLLKTLLPFISTLTVRVISLNLKHTYSEKSCTILAFLPGPDGRTLTQLYVEVLPKCSEDIDDKTMMCAADSEETKASMSNPDFCIGNSGAPLLCEGEVMALQTYINNNCSSPHLYQRLSGWEKFIICGTEVKCNESQCVGTCAITNKDVEIKSTPGSSVVVPAITTPGSSVVVPAITTPGSSVVVPAITSSTGSLTATTDDVLLTTKPEEARKSIQSEEQILQYENLLEKVPAADNKEHAPDTTTIKEHTEEIEGGVKSEENIITEQKSPKNISTVIEEPFASRPETRLVENEAKEPKVVSPESSTSEIKEAGVKIREESTTDESENDARKANMEAQVEGMQGREPEPVRTHNVLRDPAGSGGVSKWHYLCYKVAIVLTLLVIAM